jgi:pimeloyl-ACP methyl ester carboxylesterase
MIASLLLVGSLALHPCATGSAYYCGALNRPLDPSGAVPGTISIAFTWLPHNDADKPWQGTIVAAEGGPGYPSGASRGSYRALFGPLLQTHDMLLMDDRGTGNSGAIDCTLLQTVSPFTLNNVTACGDSLGTRSDLYGSALAADDLDALLHALGRSRVDIYGDSYGTFFAQVFAARHPARIRSIVLDGAYPAAGLDPWYPSISIAFRDGFDRVCRRSPACEALGGSTLGRIERLLTSLRKPGAPATPSQLAFIMASAGLDPVAYRELDAAARAFLDARDTAPLTRLVREAAEYEEEGASDPKLLSQGLFVAASCSDNPQVYDMRLPPDARQAAWQGALAAMKSTNAALYAPFTLDEFLAIPLDYGYVPLCQTWPVASPQHLAGQPIPPGTRYPAVPALVLTGDLDTITTPQQGDQAAALFPHAVRLIVKNTGHVSAVGDVDACASVIVRQFIAREPIDRVCTATIPALRLVPAFARRVADVTPATALRGNAADAQALGIAAAAVQTAGDALVRVQYLGATQALGLRDGYSTATTHGDRSTITLHGVEWTASLPVRGSVDFNSTSGAVTAQLRLPSGTLRATWRAYANAAVATISGTLNGMPVRASMPAP